MNNNNLDIILTKTKKVNYRKLGGFKSDRPITRQCYEIFTIEELLKLANSCNADIRVFEDGHIYLYNGSYWQRVEKSAFQKSLNEVALKMGVPILIGKHHKFSANLMEQFYLTAVELNKRQSKGVSVNLANGTLHVTLQGYDLRDFDKEDLHKYQLDFAYDKDADCPKFRTFLNQVLPDNSCQNVLAEYLGYVFTKGLKIEKMLVLLGQGSNGKSVIYDIVNALFGKENVTSYSLSGLTDPKSQTRAKLSTALLNYGSEMEGKVYEESLKKLISGEKIDVKEIYQKVYEIEDYAKLMFNSNQLPLNLLKGHSGKRRVILMPFNTIISEDKQDKCLAQKIIKNELPGILNWVLEGLVRLLSQGNFTYSKLLEDTLAYYSKTSNTTALFLEEEGYTFDLDSKIYKADFYRRYKEYCSCCSYKPLNRNEVREKLHLLGITEGKDKQGWYFNLRKK